MTVTDNSQQPAAAGGPEKQELLRVTGLVKHFPIRKGLLQRQVAAVQAVDGLDFTVHEGETLSLVGESGCGKSTTGRLVTRLEEPTAGQIVFEGRDITHLNERAMRPLRRDVQMIFQDPYSSLNPRHTVGKIVELADRDPLYERPMHPYPVALMSAVPIPDTKRRHERERIRLQGDVPSPINPPPACRFHTRCWKAQDICKTEAPPLAELAPRHWVACHFPENAPTGGGPAGDTGTSSETGQGTPAG